MWGTTVFRGEAPRVDDRLLKKEQSALAKNCWLTSGTARPVPIPADLAPPVNVGLLNGTIYRFSPTQWFAWAGDVDVIPGAVPSDTLRRTYWTGDGEPKMTATTIMGAFVGPGAPVSRRLGIPAPADAPAVAAVVQMDVDELTTAESHAWVYTWVSDLGEEGPPSPASALVNRTYDTAGAIQGVTITMATGETGPYGINRKRIYRTITGLAGRTTFNFLAELPAVQATYVDNVLGSGLGEVIPSIGWDPPPDDMQGLILLPNGVCAGFRGRDVYLSEPYQPHAWPADYVQVVGADVVALSSFGTVIVVLTKGDPYLLAGTHPGAMGAARMELDQSCVSKHSVARAGVQGVLYASPDGLVLVGPGGGKIVSRGSYDLEKWRAIGPENIRAFYHDNQYVAFLASGAISNDPDTGDIVEFDGDVTAGFAGREDDRLYLVIGGAIQEWRTSREFDEALATMRWRSGVNVGRLRSFSTAQVISEATETNPITFRLFAEGRMVHEQERTNSAPFRLPSLELGGDWQYEVEGMAEVKEVRDRRHE